MHAKLRTVLLFFSVLLLFSFQKERHTTHQQDFDAYAQTLAGSKFTIEMLPIPGGEFQMGSTKADEAPEHTVQVDAFWMAKYEITWDLYELFLNRNIDEEKNVKGNEVILDVDGVSSATMPYIDMSSGMGKNGYPVVNVTQYAAATFCKWLSAKTGLFYRLPTEAEWEYACRAGTTTTYSFGDDQKELDRYGWSFENSNGMYHPVGKKLPNAFGLYDMHGNASEWTLDRYDAKGYPATSGVVANPWNEAKDLYPRVARGGSWYDDPEALTSSARKPSSKNWKKIDPQVPKSLWWHTNAPFVGFRIVRPLKTPSKEEMEKYWLKAIKDM